MKKLFEFFKGYLPNTSGPAVTVANAELGPITCRAVCCKILAKPPAPLLLTAFAICEPYAWGGNGEDKLTV